jgi:hypothetical protein
MIIEVRPTSALRRRRARIAGAVVCVAMIVATVFSISELAHAAEAGPQRAPYSDPIPR